MLEPRKRPLEAGSAPAAKAARPGLDDLESSVRIKLRSMVEGRMLGVGDLDDRMITDLRALDASAALEVLENVSAAAAQGSIRNMQAYLAEAIRRRARAAGVLHPRTSQHIAALAREGALRMSELDKVCVEVLAGLHPSTAVAVLDRYAARASSGGMRNPTGMFLSIVKQVESGAPPPDRGERGAVGRWDGPGGVRWGADHQVPMPRAHAPLYGPPPGALPQQLPQLPLLAAGGGQPLVLLSGAGGAQLLAPLAAPLAGASGYAGVPAAPAAAAAAVAALPPGVPAEWAAGRRQYGLQQAQLGVRVSEFHGLSGFAVFMHPSPALKLQQLWDEGNELVSMLDDAVWQCICELPTPAAVAVVEEAAAALASPAGIRNINAFIMSSVRKHMPDGGAPGGNQGAPGGSYVRGGAVHDAYNGYALGGGPVRRRDPDGGRAVYSRAPGLHLLTAEQQALARALCADHAPLLLEEHFDEGVASQLSRLSPGQGLAVLQELGQNSLAGVRNVPAFITGIVRRHLRGGC